MFSDHLTGPLKDALLAVVKKPFADALRALSTQRALYRVTTRAVDVLVRQARAPHEAATRDALSWVPDWATRDAVFGLALDIALASSSRALAALRADFEAQSGERGATSLFDDLDRALSAFADALTEALCDEAEQVDSPLHGRTEFDLLRRMAEQQEAGNAAIRLLITESHGETQSHLLQIERQLERLPQAVSQHLAVAPPPPSPATGHDRPAAGVHEEITLAASFTGRGHPDVTLELLNRMRRERWENLDARARYRVLANIGTAHAVRLEFADAAASYLAAAEHQPDDPDAQAFAVIAYLHLDGHARAHELATRLRQRFPAHGRIAAMWIRSAPAEIPYGELAHSVAPALQQHAEVATALASRAVAANELGCAEAHARAAVAGAPDWREAKGELAAILIMRATAGWIPGHGLTLSPAATRLLDESVTLLTDVIDGSRLGAPRASLAPHHVNRATAYQLLGRSEETERDMRAAFECAPADAEIVTRYAVSVWERGDRDMAIAALRQHVAVAPAPSPSVVYSLVQMLVGRARPGDRAEAICLLHAGLPRLGEFPLLGRIDWLERLVELDGAGDAARSLGVLDGLPVGLLPPGVAVALRARAYLAAGNRAEAEALARPAIDALGSDANVEERRQLARLAMALGWFAEALPLWQVLSPTGSLTSDSFELLECARRLGEDGLILDYCAALRAEGRLAPAFLEAELNILQHYHATAETMAVMEHWLATPLSDGLATTLRVNLALVAARLGQHERARAIIPQLPPPEAVDVRLGRLVVDVLRSSDVPERAVAYAYQLWRRFPDRVEAFDAVIASFNLVDGQAPRLVAPSTVEAGAAVRYREDDTGKERSWIIEDGAQPRPELDELAPGHPLARALLGRRVGERVMLPTAFAPLRSATITEILPKYVHRFQDCLLRHGDLFPGQLPIQMIALREDPGGSIDPEPLLAIGRPLRRRRQQAEAIYRAHPTSLYLFAGAMHFSPIEAVHHLARSEGLFIRGRPEIEDVRDAALSVLIEMPTLVLDLTAIATLLLLGEEGVLAELPLPLVVAESTLQELRALASTFERAERSRLGEDAVPDDGATPASWATRLVTLVQSLEAKGRVESGLALARLPKEERARLVDFLGPMGAESVALARRPRHVLWTDDLVAAELASGGGTGAAVWTQPVLAWLRGNGVLSSVRFTRATLQLLQADYAATILEPADVMEAIRRAYWQPDQPPLRQVLTWLEDVLLSPSRVVELLDVVLPSVWREAPLAMTAPAEFVTAAIFLEVVGNPGGLGAVAAALDRLDSVSGDDAAWAAPAKALISALLTLCVMRLGAGRPALRNRRSSQAAAVLPLPPAGNESAA